MFPLPGSNGQETLVPGTRAGDYVIGELLARGGSGAVYRAERPPGGQALALKVLHPEHAAAPAAIARFAREVEAIRRIRHPNVVEVHDLGQLPDGRPYYTMDLLDGLDLGAHVAAAGRLGLDEVLAILDPLAAALGAAHARSIVHRDLKPSNVFLAQAGGARRVVLLDFGIAKLLDQVGLTSSREAVGTPAFMAPEQIRGEPTDARADLYALGALVYFMLTGELPFRTSSAVPVERLQLHARPPRPSERAPVPRSVDEVVLRAMSRDPARRPLSAAALLDELRRAAAAPPSPTPTARRAAAVHVEIALDPMTEELLDDAIDALLPAARAFLERRGFRSAFEASSAALFVRDLPPDPAADASARRDAAAAASTLGRELRRRTAALAGVRWSVCLHAGLLPSSAPGPGDLLDLASWVPEQAPPGVVLATDAAIAGLDLPLDPPSTPGAARALGDLGDTPGGGPWHGAGR